MGWSMPWVSSAGSDFNFDLGFSSSEEQTRGWVAPILDQLPPIAGRNARKSGTDIVGYLTESQGLSAFILDDEAVYHTYSTGARRGRRLSALDPPPRRIPRRMTVRGRSCIWSCTRPIGQPPARSTPACSVGG